MQRGEAVRPVDLRIWLLALLAGLTLAPAGEAQTVEPLTFDRDSYADLAIGVPLEDVQVVQGTDVVTREDAGAVNVLYGESGGLTAVGDQFWHQGLGTVSGSAEGDDQFGVALAAGDFDGDRTVDLAVGVSYEDVNTTDGTEENSPRSQSDAGHASLCLTLSRISRIRPICKLYNLSRASREQRTKVGVHEVQSPACERVDDST